MKKNYLLVHGSFGSPHSNWFPWLREKIQEGGRIKHIPKIKVDMKNAL